MPSTQQNLPNEVTRPMFSWRPKKGLLSYGCSFPELLRAHISRTGKQRVFAVISKSLVENTTELERLKECLGKKLIGVQIGFPSHPPFLDVLNLSNEVRASEADAIVTLGGGSIIDAAKLVAFCLANDTHDFDGLERLSKATACTMESDNDYANYIDPPGIKPATLIRISIPTTLSAGEYSPYAGAVDPRDGVKKLFIHQSLSCDIVILDPELTKTVPEWVWMSSGVRSIDHCVELLASLRQHETQTEEAAKTGLVMVARGLLKLRAKPEDIESRLATQIGSNYAMDGLSRGVHLGASHAIGHQLGTMNVVHGHTSCILSPAVMKYNACVNGDRQKHALNTLWEDPYIAHVLTQRGLSQTESDLGDTLDAIFRELGVPRTLKDVGVTGDVQLKTLSERSLEDPWCRTNPIPLTRPEQVLEILRMVEK